MTPPTQAAAALIRRQALLDLADDCERQARERTDQRAAADLFREAIIARAAALALEASA